MTNFLPQEGQPVCGTLNWSSPECQDCCFGAHAISATTFWTMVNAYNARYQIQGPILPKKLYGSELIYLIEGVSCYEKCFLTDIPYVDVNGDQAIMRTNQNISFRVAPKPEPNENPSIITTVRSITLMEGIRRNLNPGLTFNFYKGLEIEAEEEKIYALFNVSNKGESEIGIDGPEQILYYCDFSGVLP